MATGTKLSVYRRKRDFQATPEPPPGRARRARPRAPSFVVHKHDASRLHYDLRLEMDGALASWAIPKGPSYDPKIRRLAVQTEDHPIEYGSFEGRIPEGQYGAGDSIIWDRGTYDTDPPGQASAMRKKGHIVFELRGHKLSGRWHLVRTRAAAGETPQWLFFKSSKDEHARADYDVVAERPESVVSGKRVTRGPLRQRTLREHRLSPGELLDRASARGASVARGTRAPRRAPDGRVRSRSSPADGSVLLAVSHGDTAVRDLDGTEPRKVTSDLRRASASLPVAEAVLEGRLASAGKRFIASDLRWLDGEDLRDRSLSERRDLLDSVLANASGITSLSRR